MFASAFGAPCHACGCHACSQMQVPQTRDFREEYISSLSPSSSGIMAGECWSSRLISSNMMNDYNYIGTKNRSTLESTAYLVGLVGMVHRICGGGHIASGGCVAFLCTVFSHLTATTATRMTVKVAGQNGTDLLLDEGVHLPLEAWPRVEDRQETNHVELALHQEEEHGEGIEAQNDERQHERK
jgi:hypothetical protein